MGCVGAVPEHAVPHGAARQRGARGLLPPSPKQTGHIPPRLRAVRAAGPRLSARNDAGRDARAPPHPACTHLAAAQNRGDQSQRQVQPRHGGRGRMRRGRRALVRPAVGSGFKGCGFKGCGGCPAYSGQWAFSSRGVRRRYRTRSGHSPFPHSTRALVTHLPAAAARAGRRRPIRRARAWEKATEGPGTPRTPTGADLWRPTWTWTGAKCD